MDPWGTPQLRVIEREETFLQADKKNLIFLSDFLSRDQGNSVKKKNQTDKTGKSMCIANEI